LKIRESGGVVYFDYSSDGVNWNNFWYDNVPFDLTSLYVEIGAGTYQSEILPGQLKIEGVNAYKKNQNCFCQSKSLYFW
jgi:hypothetical protein